MQRLEISRIAIDAGGRLLIHPARVSASFEYIYRAAAEVYWDPVHLCFACPPRREWSHLRWFEHARSVIRGELGLELHVNDATTWGDVPDELRDAIRAPVLTKLRGSMHGVDVEDGRQRRVEKHA